MVVIRSGEGGGGGETRVEVLFRGRMHCAEDVIMTTFTCEK